MALPSLRTNAFGSKQAVQETGAYGMQDVMVNGFTCVKNSLAAVHPLEESERQYNSNVEKMQFSTSRSIQGLHAPIKLAAERNAARQIGRLPSLPSSNLMLEVLEGNDETINFEDIYNDPMEMVEVLRPPQFVMEKHLRLS
ncbi:proteasome maturation protein-like [Ornithodoros turicata]|uniref:proteasome maturation protein-like n=1 Tax=Ornithodoros turicata TaxID=34597 RepID=UPI0031396B63